MDNIHFTEHDKRNINRFINFILVFTFLAFFAILWVHLYYPYTYYNGCFQFQPELSWYSGPINNCGCR